MSTPLAPPPAVSPAAAEGDVRVEIRVSAPPEAAWRALTDPAVVGRWFGELRGTLRPGERARLDFGDGDFFALQTLEAEPPRLLRYAWRFLGTGPRDTIAWEIAPEGGGARVTVTDRQPGRSRRAAEELREGWLDFTSRLERYLETGEDARYDWRRELDGSAELGVEPERVRELLVQRETAGRWLPLGAAGLEEGARWRLDDGEAPDALVLAELRETPEGGLGFELSHPGWARPTRCRVAVHPFGGAALLAFSHLGWEEISRDPAECLRQRRRLADSWVAALERARALAG